MSAVRKKLTQQEHLAKDRAHRAFDDMDSSSTADPIVRIEVPAPVKARKERSKQ